MLGHPITLRLPDGTSAAATHDDAWKLQQLLWARVAWRRGRCRQASWLHIVVVPEDRPLVDFKNREAVAVAAAAAAAASVWITWTNDNWHDERLEQPAFL